MAGPGNSNLISLYGLLEGMECEIQSVLKAFLAKVREEISGSDTKFDEQQRGQIIVERAIITLTRVLMTLKDNEKMKTPQYSEDSFPSENTSSSSVPGVTMADVTTAEALKWVEFTDLSKICSQPMQSDLKEKQDQLETSAGQIQEVDMILLRDDIGELTKRFHQLENKQNSFCLKEELEVVGNKCLSRQSELEKKQVQIENVADIIEERQAQLEQDMNEFKQVLSSFPQLRSEIKKLNEMCKEIVVRQNEFMLKKDQEATNTMILSTHDQLKQQYTYIDNSVSNLKKQINTVEKNVSRNMDEVRQRLKNDSLKSGKKQLEEAVTMLENAIVERMQQEELLNDRVQHVHSKAEQAEEKMLTVNEKMIRMEEQMKRSHSKTERSVAQVTVQCAEMNALIQSKIKNLEDLRKILNNIRDRSSFAAKIDALENQVTSLAQRLGKSNYSPVAFSVRLKEDQVMKEGYIIKNFSGIICNLGSALDTTSGMFTAPQDGLYVFGAALIKRLPCNGMLVIQMFSQNSSSLSPRTILYLQAKETEISCSGMAVLELRTNDQVYLKVTKGGNQLKLFQESCFCGWLQR